MVGNKAILPRHLFKIRPGYEVIICFTYCKQSKLEVGEVLLRGCESRNAGLISFQDQVSLLSWSDIATSLIHRPSPMWASLDCNITHYMSASQSHWISNHNAQYKSNAHGSYTQPLLGHVGGVMTKCTNHECRCQRKISCVTLLLFLFSLSQE